MTDLSQYSNEELLGMLNQHVNSNTNQPEGQQISNGQRLPPSNANAFDNQQEPNPVLKLHDYFTDKPNITYGNILPFSRDEKTGETSLAFPEAIRSPMRGLTEMMGRAVPPATDNPLAQDRLNLSPDALGAVAMMSPTSVALRSKMGFGSANNPEPIGNKLLSSASRPNEMTNIEDQSINQLMTSSMPKPNLPNTSEAVRSLASKSYQEAEQKGGTLTPEFTNNFLNEATKVAPQTEAGKIVAGDNQVTQLVERMQALKDKPLSLSEAQEVDETLGDLIDSEYGIKGMSKQGKKLYDIQSTFRNMIEDAGPQDIQGGSSGFDALKQGRQLWSQSAKMRDVEKIISRAQDMDNPATSIKTGFRNLVNSPRVRGFSPEELEAAKAAAKTGIATDALRVFGSRLGPIITSGTGFATGNPFLGMIGGAANYGLSTGMRNLATKMQMNKAKNVLDVLAKGTQQ